MSDQWTQGFFEELNMKMEETQLGLQAVTTSLMQTSSLRKVIADAKKDLP
jgi:hypothetical protein